MKVSVIYSACNQGEFLQKTVDSAIQGLDGCRDWEIVVVDDQSDDGCCDFLLMDRDHDKYPDERVRLIRPEGKLGVSHARHLAAENTDGDVIITSDTHCFYQRRSLYRLASCWAMNQRAIIVPPVQLRELGKEDGPYVEGGKFEISSRGIRILRPRRAPQWPAMYGSIYVMRRDVWNHLGAWLRLPGYWGGEEQMVATVAYLFGVPIRVLSKADYPQHLCIHQQYRKHAVYPYPMPKHHPWEIAHYYHAACFPETYEDVWKPMLLKRYNHKPESDPAPLRDWIKERAVWDEHRFFRTVLGVEGKMRDHPLVKQVLDGPTRPVRDNPVVERPVAAQDDSQHP